MGFAKVQQKEQKKTHRFSDRLRCTQARWANEQLRLAATVAFARRGTDLLGRKVIRRTGFVRGQTHLRYVSATRSSLRFAPAAASQGDLPTESAPVRGHGPILQQTTTVLPPDRPDKTVTFDNQGFSISPNLALNNGQGARRAWQFFWQHQAGPQRGQGGAIAGLPSSAIKSLSRLNRGMANNGVARAG